MPLSHAILGFLEYQPMTGYDLKKLFDQSVAHFWSATQSHIYKALENLEKEGLVESQIIQGEGKPNRKEYHITEAGTTELRRWLVTPLPLEPVRDATMIQIFFSHFSTDDEITALFAARMQATRERLQVLQTLAQAAIDENADRIGIERVRQLWQITLDYGIAYYDFELAWQMKTLATIRNLPPLTPPNPRAD